MITLDAHDISESWKLKQIELKKFLNLENSEQWQHELDYKIENVNDIVIPDHLRYIGGIDISFDKTSNNNACVCIAIVDSSTKKLLAKHEKLVTITEPYIVNYLAFRECEHMVNTVKEFLVLHPNLKPQVLLVDGNGMYHQSGFGSASHLGVRLEQEGIIIPTVRVAKNYLQLQGMTSREELKAKIAQQIHGGSEVMLELTNGNGNSPICIVRRCDKPKSSSQGDKLGKLAFISVGHRITLTTATNVVRISSNCRMPEPILQADHYAKDFLIKINKKISIKILRDSSN